MLTQCQVALPERLRLEEINLPEPLVARLAGQTVTVEVIPEFREFARSFHKEKPPDFCPVFIRSKDHSGWNAYWPKRITYTDEDGRQWRIPGIG